MNHKETWQASWENGVLHISGITDLFPNEFSTSSLERIENDGDLLYKIVFHRDKEPFCNSDLVGPVHYFESNLPKGIKAIKIMDGKNDHVEIPIPTN
jgi:hypothetical protein